MPPHRVQVAAPVANAPQARRPVTSRAVVRWLGVTGPPTSGRTIMRDKRWVQDVNGGV